MKRHQKTTRPNAWRSSESRLGVLARGARRLANPAGVLVTRGYRSTHARLHASDRRSPESRDALRPRPERQAPSGQVMPCVAAQAWAMTSKTSAETNRVGAPGGGPCRASLRGGVRRPLVLVDDHAARAETVTRTHPRPALEPRPLRDHRNRDPVKEVDRPVGLLLINLQLNDDSVHDLPFVQRKHEPWPGTQRSAPRRTARPRRVS